MSSSRPANKRVFGQATRQGPSRYQRQQGNGSKSQGSSHSARELTEEQEIAQRRLKQKLKRRAQDEAFDERSGYRRYCHWSGDSDVIKKEDGEDQVAQTAVKSRRGWVFNMLPTTISSGAPASASSNDASSSPSGPERAGLDLYFLTEDGSTFKSTILYDPYFYIVAKPPLSSSGNQYSYDDENYGHTVFYDSLISTLMRKYEPQGLKSVKIVKKQDLDSLNHLSHTDGKPMFQLSFDTVQQLMDVRKELQPLIQKNRKLEKESSHQFYDNTVTTGEARNRTTDSLATLIDIREYDVPYLVRVCIDLNVRAGAWYTVTPNTQDIGVTLSEQDIETKANPKCLAFDIECTKAPLKFPDANIDSIFMISYMIDGQGYLIISRHIVGTDINDFEYTPKPGYPGPFKIFNELDEEGLIRRFLSEYQRLRPQIVVTYNGDFFDWPFLEQRAAKYGFDMRTELGVERVGTGGGSAGGGAMSDAEYRGRTSVHLDAFSWVKRDSYLPQGSQGLKAVTKYKLGYDPVEVDPEDMVRFARERPVHMASYSVSDAVATYYLYMKYVHMFIFSLCTIIPMGPEDVLRKGSGTLCEALLMVQSCTKDIICPNKQIDPLAKFHQGHLLESETYIGGKVECLETGVYRSDIEYKFDLKSTAFQQLIDNIDRDMTFAIEVEGGIDRNTVTNYDEIRCEIIEKLEMLRDRPSRTERPFVYHLDVGAMYPNIILTNRLQPSAIVDDSVCAACDFNQQKNDCKRKMDWVWRGDYNPASKSEYDRTKDQLSRERFEDGKSFHEFDEVTKEKMVTLRLKQYSKNAYRKTKITEEVTKKDTVCMRENDFYVDTVRNFRDKRYELKKLTKVWSKKIKSAKDALSKKEAEDRTLVYDSLQVAHKCILNSFYGYVMRKGARWRSMEMAGIVTKTGADLITQARILVEQIGRPLELDTDGIWCILPQSFPDVFNFQLKDGSKLRLEYPCIMLNADVHDNFTNHQYQTLVDPVKNKFESRSECSIFFEVDGPYRCMVLPSSTEEGKLLKKRYAVFNEDGSLAELKGFELKRRGELELIKQFQGQVFERFLDGKDLVECYDSVAEIANYWIDVLDTQGESLETEELFDLISENRSMSRQLEDYGSQKGTSQTTARRLGEFLGAEIIKDKGLNCRFLISERPHGAPVTERAIPTAIWKAETAVMKHFLRKWLKSPGMEDDDFDIRNILDWEYYRDRLGKSIQKIITIPAALQKVSNPVPRIPHPDWLKKTVSRLNDRHKQQSITKMFVTVDKNRKDALSTSAVTDIEDMMGAGRRPGRPVVHRSKRSMQANADINEDDNLRNNPLVPVTKNIISPEKEVPKVPLTNKTYQDWLARKKSIWNFREKRKRKRAQRQVSIPGTTFESEEITSKKQRKGVGSMTEYIRDAAQSLLQFEWHILEIREISSSNAKAGGEFIVWVMLSNGSLQKINVTTPRFFYINCKEEIKEIMSSSLSVKRVERYLPHNKAMKNLYEISLPEHLYHGEEWLETISEGRKSDVIESFYEVNHPSLLRALASTGSVCRVNSNSISKGGKYMLSDLKRVENPREGEYLNKNLGYRKVFFYESTFPRSKTGLVAVLVLDGSSKDDYLSTHESDFKRNMTCKCNIWVVKPGGEKGQRAISKRNCEVMFSEILQQIKEASEEMPDSEYACISDDATCSLNTLSFVRDEKYAFKGAHEILNTYAQGNNGPTLLLMNCKKPIAQLRKSVPSLNSYPLIELPLPPGHGTTSLPSLNWEPHAVHMCLEAYFYMGAISLPRRISYSKFSDIPIGNLGTDANVTTYDVSLSRLLLKNRALSWASDKPGCPDTGRNSLPLVTGSTIKGLIGEQFTAGKELDTNDLWGDEDENVKPVISFPGAYRSICVEIDVHNLAIAAITDTKGLLAGIAPTLGKNMSGDALIDTTPLGDEMSTAISLPLLRTLAQSWLREASEFNNAIADRILGQFYRLLSSPDPALNDPALHRVILSLMRATFNQLLNEFQRLGCTIVCSTFNRIVVATKKYHLSDAMEYIEFIIATIKKSFSDEGIVDGLSRLSLQPSNYYSHYLFLDEHNFGAILFENRDPEDDEEAQWAFSMETPNAKEDEEKNVLMIVPTVVSGWNILHYLPSDISQEYFRALIGRYSKDVYRKQALIEEKLLESESQPQSQSTSKEMLLSYKKKLIAKHFASDLTRAVAEINKEGGGPESFPILPGSHLNLVSPALEFVKNILVVLELDSDVDKEVQIIKKSLLAQIGVQEYSSRAKWYNPCARFILPDVFCSVCQESRDVDLCVLPPPIEEDEIVQWTCEDCHTPFDAHSIEIRLVDAIEQKCLRYQLQDLRCVKTSRVATRVLSHHSQNSSKLKADISRKDIMSQLHILHNLASYYNLDYLLETINILHNLV